VWQSITHQIDTANAQDEFVSTADVPRSNLAIHPWSIGGGGAVDLLEAIEENGQQALSTITESIGRTTVVGEDDCWIIEAGVAIRHNFQQHCLKLGLGDCFRDWQASDLPTVIYPYCCLVVPIHN
jgi:hypothetical protein